MIGLKKKVMKRRKESRNTFYDSLNKTSVKIIDMFRTLLNI